MRHLRRHAHGFPKGWMRANRLANVHGICTLLNGLCNLTRYVACVRADHAAT